MNEYLIGKDRN